MDKTLLHDFLNIESQTFEEQKATTFLYDFLITKTSPSSIKCEDDSVIACYESNPTNPTLALVGHSDVVPAFFTPYEKEGNYHGAGASDMKGSVACYLSLLAHHREKLLVLYNIILIVYPREEMTPLEKNGLNAIIKREPDLIKRIDCAIVGEPTDNTVQLGCLGSLHAKVTIRGKEAHSARPWQGENALYKSVPLIQACEHWPSKEETRYGVTFKEVLSITEGHVQPGRTTVPGEVSFNLNHRFLSSKTQEDALRDIHHLVASAGVSNSSVHLIDSAPSGSVIETDLVTHIIKTLNKPIEAKQAWTDVAQLTSQGIPSFNYGPGFQSQAHKPNEYIDLDYLADYYDSLYKLLTKKEPLNE